MGNIGINEIIAIVKELPYLTKQNLGVALGKEGENLNYWMKKLTKEQIIVPVKKGFYISPYYRDTQMKTPEQVELYWVCVANALRAPSYVSLEYVLSKYNIIPEATFALTSVTLKSSRVYKTSQATFVYRSIKQDLFYAYQLVVFGNLGLTVRIAYPYKALFDYLYLRPFSSKTQMKEYVLTSSRFNWDAVTKEDKDGFIKVVEKSGSKKMLTIVKILQKAGVF